MTFMQLGRHIHWRPDRVKPEVAMMFYEKLSKPLGCLILIFVAAPLAFVHSRKMNKEGMPYIAAIVIGFYIMQSSFSALGDTGRMIPFFAAFLPNVVLLTFSIGMILLKTDALYVPDVKGWLFRVFRGGRYQREIIDESLAQEARDGNASEAGVSASDADLSSARSEVVQTA
jgi:hypothetical protein